MKNWFQKNPKIVLSLGLVLFLVIGGLYVYFMLLKKTDVKVTDYESCVASQKGVTREIYPAECEYKGKIYTQQIPEDSINNKGDEGINLELPENERVQIEAWLEKNNYNQYGDSPDTVYLGGTPLFDEAKGTYIKLYDYLVTKYPEKPWLKSSASPTINTQPEVKSFTSVKSWLNFNDPNFELQYPDFVNIANQNGYPVRFTSDDGFEFVIYVDTKAPSYDSGTCEKKINVDELGVYLCYNTTKTYQELYQRMIDSFVAR